MSRLVNVSNRVALPRGAPAAGGLAVGVLAAMRRRRGLWFGWNGEIEDQAAEPAVQQRDGISYATMPLSRSMYDRYYSGFANTTLWPLLHCFLGALRYEEDQYRAYQDANALFARKLLPLLEPDDLLWVHDYHLVPLAGKLRALGIGNPLGFFMHVPFPHVEILSALPPCREFVRGMLEYDVLGFQTQADRDCFLGSVRTLCTASALGPGGTIRRNGRRIVTGVFPIGVDVEAVAREAAAAVNSSHVARTVRGLAGRALIVGVDRLDYSKGLLERFEGYRHFLEMFPAQNGHVTYLQIAPLGRQDVRAYSQLRVSLEQSAGRTNGAHAQADWTPIRYLNRNFPHPTLMGFLRAARVCLVTPLKDGMNLVAKEFIAAQDAADPGVLVLSDRAGAAHELRDAVLVNPYDTRAIARAIQAALTMPIEERRSRHASLLGAVKSSHIQHWHTRFVDELQATRRWHEATA